METGHILTNIRKIDRSMIQSNSVNNASCKNNVESCLKHFL